MKRLLFLSVLVLLPGVVAAQSSEPRKVASVEGVSEYQFDNGARLLLFPEPSKPVVTVNMTVLVGSRHEGYGEAGMAHLLEHMVFKGTPSFPDVPTALRDHGASYNGTTNSDRTNYFETLPATDENLEFAIQLECDRLVNSFIRHEDLMSEFTVVRNEFERGENSPQGVLMQRIMAAAYEWHNYGKTTIGNRSDIERVPIDNLRAFYRKFYQPDNIVLIVTGRFEEARALELAKKHLGSIPRPERKLTAAYTEEPAQDGERLVTLNRVGDIGSVAAAYHMPAAAHEDWAALNILASVLSEEKVGLLEKSLVESGIATSASARADNSWDPGLFFLSASPAEGQLEQTREALLAAMDSLQNHSFETAAVDRAKMRAQRASENMENDAGRMSQALSSASSVGDWRLLFLQRDRVAAVTMDDVNRVARTYFPVHNRTVGMFIPTESPRRMQIPVVASIPDLVKDYNGGVALEFGEAFDTSPENLDARVQTIEMDGLKIGMLQKKNRGETVNLTMTLHFGNEESLNGQTTAAGMLPQMLMAGTSTLDRQALQARMSELGIRVSPGGGGGGRRGGRGGGGMGAGTPGDLTFSIEAKRSSLAPAIKLVGEILRDPAFPESDFDQAKNRMASMLKQFGTEPQLLASNEMSRALSNYPADDVRYAPTLDETIERIEKLTLEDIRSVYKSQLSSAVGEIAIVGEFEPQEVLPVLGEILADWNSEVEYRSIDRQAVRDLSGAKMVIETPDKANAVFTAGLAFAMDESHPDVEALELGNFILGGGTLSSRLGTRIRQKEGLSYGVSSSLSIPARGDDARFTINAITNPDNMDAVEAAAMEELNRFLNDGVTAQEVSDAQTAWLESQKVSRAADGSIAGQIRTNLNLGRTFGFMSEKKRRIAALTPEAIQAAFKKHIDPDKLIVIRAGDFGK